MKEEADMSVFGSRSGAIRQRIGALQGIPCGARRNFEAQVDRERKSRERHRL